MIDQKSDLSHVHMGKVTLSGTSAVASSLVDMQGFQALTVVVVAGTITDAGAAAGYTVKLQESDSTAAASFTDVAAADMVGDATFSNTVDTDDDKIVGVLGYVGHKRYVRAVATGTTASAGDLHPIGIRGVAAVAPVTAIVTATAAT